MRILTLNCGSSSVKFRLSDFQESRSEETCLRPEAAGDVKGIGGEATLRCQIVERSPVVTTHVVKDHEQALHWVFEQLKGRTIDAVGHRVVHGGDAFAESIRIDAPTLTQLEQLTELAPLHNPACLAGIRGARRYFGEHLPMVAVFDTAFHRFMPDYASTYAIPHEVAARHRIKRYGFHGIAHASLISRYATETGQDKERLRAITLQLGNGCSAAAILNGRSVDTSMGFTPLEGLMMGTRSGDLDPALVSYLARQEGFGVEAVEQMLNEQSGLRGVSGLSHDMAALLEAEKRLHPGAMLAIDMFCYRVRKYIGAYLAVLGGAEAIIFGGGIGEHAPEIRARICGGLEWCGLQLDPMQNATAVNLASGEVVRISRDGGSPAAYVVAVDEETEMTRETFHCVNKGVAQ